MGCKFSSTKEKDPPSRTASVKHDKSATPEIAAAAHNTHADHVRGGSGKDTTPDSTAPPSPEKRHLAHVLPAADENELADEDSNEYSPNGTRATQPPGCGDGEDNREGEGGSGTDLNGSFANVDLNGSFHIHYTTKGDILPNATLPESRRGRSVSPKLLAALSPHPSDDEQVLICTDCGMTIDENSEVLCPLTGKLHV